MERFGVSARGAGAVDFDDVVALVAGLVIFPVVFTNGLEAGAGPGLLFQTLPVAFAQMPGGYLFSILFFLMLSVAVGCLLPLAAFSLLLPFVFGVRFRPFAEFAI